MPNFQPSIRNTTAVCSGFLRAALGNEGYEVTENGSFLEAANGEQSLAILSVSRCLSNRASVESTPVAASAAGVRKLLERYRIQAPVGVLARRDASALDTIVGDANMIGKLCIAFCVCKYSYADIEVVVVPVGTILREAETGSVFSIGSRTGDLFYDYAKANNDNTRNVILRRRFIDQTIAE